MKSYPVLEALFATTSADYSAIVAADGDGFHRALAEHLLQNRAASEIAGVEKIAADSARANIGKFANLVSELSFAFRFAKLGAKVELLRDDAFRPAAYTPDLCVTYPNGVSFLVDVVHGTRGTASLAEYFVARQPKDGLKFDLEQFVGIELSVPRTSRAERTEQEELCARVVDEVHRVLAIAGTAGVDRGLIRIFTVAAELRHDLLPGESEQASLYDSVAPKDGEKWLGSFSFEPQKLHWRLLAEVRPSDA